jgi:hypothetical protein
LAAPVDGSVYTSHPPNIAAKLIRITFLIVLLLVPGSVPFA